jgi:hypothetical protein
MGYATQAGPANVLFFNKLSNHAGAGSDPALSLLPDTACPR